MMDGKLDESLRDLWRWRPDRVGLDLASEERPRRPKIELKDAEGWNHDEEKENH
jgi:sarcosine oxidase/L-pipecolate oxidase